MVVIPEVNNTWKSRFGEEFFLDKGWLEIGGTTVVEILGSTSNSLILAYSFPLCFSLNHDFSNFGLHQNHLEGSWKNKNCWPCPQSFWFSKWVKLENLHFHQVPGGADTAGLDPLMENHCLRPSPLHFDLRLFWWSLVWLLFPVFLSFNASWHKLRL